MRKATPEQLAALKIEETRSGPSQRRSVRIQPRAQVTELQALLRNLGLHEPDQNAGENPLQRIVREISRRGSSGPIVTDDDEDEEG